jgi:hypothetical protein
VEQRVGKKLYSGLRSFRLSLGRGTKDQLFGNMKKSHGRIHEMHQTAKLELSILEGD